MVKILFNPFGHNKTGRVEAKKIAAAIEGDVVVFDDITQIEDIYTYLREDKSDMVVVAGGDGTLNRIINDINGRELPREIYYYPAGSGNDFKNDVQENNNGHFLINDYIKKLPTIEIGEKKMFFLNGVGFGIDGYCCEVGDKLRAKSEDKPINYTSIALRALLSYRPSNAKITVDGVEHKFKKVWIAPIMNGRFYGGGMMVAPGQVRNNEAGTLSCVVVHGCTRFKILVAFPTIFKGEHLKYKKMVEVFEGHEITVEYDRPTAAQVDGETVLGASYIKGTSAYTKVY